MALAPDAGIEKREMGPDLDAWTNESAVLDGGLKATNLRANPQPQVLYFVCTTFCVVPTLLILGL